MTNASAQDSYHCYEAQQRSRDPWLINLAFLRFVEEVGEVLEEAGTSDISAIVRKTIYLSRQVGNTTGAVNMEARRIHASRAILETQTGLLVGYLGGG
jgi:hypothetical protein